MRTLGGFIAALDESSSIGRQLSPPVLREVDDPLKVSFLLPDPAPLQYFPLVAKTTTPLQEAAKQGRASDLQNFLMGKVDCLFELTPLNESLLHLAVQNGHFEATKVLLDYAKGRSYCTPFINTRDSGGNTVLHLAIARKNLQVVKLLLEDSAFAGIIAVNSRNNGGFTALDMLDVLSDAGERTEEICKILQSAGALRGRDLMEYKVDNIANQELLIEVGNCHSHPQQSPPKPYRSRPIIDSYHVALLLATIFATMTFHAALRADSLSVRMLREEQSPPENTIIREQETVFIVHAFVYFNSLAFFTSVALITILLHQLPFKPWLLISVLSSSGAYICAIKANFEDDVVTVAIIGASILLAAFLSCLALKSKVFNYEQGPCHGIPII